MKKIIKNNFYLKTIVIIILTIMLFELIFNIKQNISLKSKNMKNINKILSNEEALERGKKYLNICKRGLLINNINFSKAKIPKISVIIPVYNSEKTIKSTIRSVQNQNMIDIEIILVNDFSNNETIKIIKEIKIKDTRIEILNNKKNMGILYSRSIGVLNSKVKYITTIDNDDIFCDKDVFDIIYREADNDNFDIISFKAFKNYSIDKYTEFYKEDKFEKNNLTVYQPELGIFAINKNYPLFQNNILIWGKLIKSNIYKNAVKLLGKKRYSTYLIWAEDTCIFFVICSVAQSLKFIDKFGLIHFIIHTSSGIRI